MLPLVAAGIRDAQKEKRGLPHDGDSDIVEEEIPFLYLFLVYVTLLSFVSWWKSVRASVQALFICCVCLHIFPVSFFF